MSLPPIMASIKAGIEKKSGEETLAKQEVFGLGTDDEAPPLQTITDAINNIRGLMEQQEIPFNTIEIGLKNVMKLLKSYEDVVLELQEEDIATIVTSYMALADEETKTIFDKASKAKKKAVVKQSVKKILAAAKEDTGEVDLSDLDL